MGYMATYTTSATVSLSLSDFTEFNAGEAGNMNLDNLKDKAFIKIKTF